MLTYGQGLVSLAARARALRIFLWLFVGLSAIGIPYALWQDYAYSETAIPTAVLRMIMLAYGGASLITLLGCAILIPMWTYRAWANLHTLGLRGLRRSPGWAAGSFFVPIAGLFVPFLAMRELFNRSTGEDEDRADASAGDVTSWWTCWIAGNLIQGFVVLTAIFNTNGLVFIVTPQIMTQALTVFGNLLMMGAGWFLIRTVGEITTAQSSSAGISETFA